MNTVTINGRDITVREFSISEIRAWFKALTSQTPGNVDLIGELLFDDISMRELLLLTDVNPVTLESISPSTLAPLIDAVIAANQHWVACRRKIVELVKVTATAQLAQAKQNQGSIPQMS